MRLAREAGIKVVLSGQGGDEFWDGYYGSIWNYLAVLVRQGRWLQCMTLARQFGARYNIPAHQLLVQALGHAVPSEPIDAYRAWAFRRRAKWLKADFRMDARRSRESRNDLSDYNVHERYLVNVSTAWTLPGFLHFEDRNSMHFGVEVRVPFLDYRLVELGGTIDPKVKMAGGQTKAVLRAALRGITPDAVLDRHLKQPFPVPIDRWLRGPSRVLDDVVERSDEVPFADPSAVRRMVADYREGTRQVATTDMWRMLSTILWYSHQFGSGINAT